MIKILTFILFFFLLLNNCYSQKRNSIKEKFNGTWRLDQYESLNKSTGKWEPDSSKTGYSGYIMYDGYNHMSVQIVPKGYSDFETSKSIDDQNFKELKTTAKFFRSNLVYFANYQVKVDTVEHNILSCTEPSIIGNVLRRQFNFKGDTLILTPLSNSNASPSGRLVWIKN